MREIVLTANQSYFLIVHIMFCPVSMEKLFSWKSYDPLQQS